MSDPAKAPGSQLPVDNPNPQQTVAEMAELIGGLAHELRNPLSTLMVNLKLLAEDLNDLTADPEDTRRRSLVRVGTLQREAGRLQSLFDEFLHLTDPFKAHRTEEDINDIVGRLLAFFEPSARGGGIRIEFTLADGPLVCRVDESHLRRALLNILINAQQAMPHGGTMTVTTRAEGASAVIEIADTGTGISEEDRERVLRPFFSTKAEGSGLGLSITQRVIHEHGGTLSFESRRDAGTTFTIRLPRPTDTGLGG